MPQPDPRIAAVISDWTGRLRTIAPDVIAVFLRGSHARGNATAFSDIDFEVITASPREDSWPVFIDDRNGRLFHVSVALTSLDGHRDECLEPANYAFGLPLEVPRKRLWVHDDHSGNPALAESIVQPAADPELEDCISAYGKLVAKTRADDLLAATIASRDIAEYLPAMLLPLNPPVVVTDRISALEAALAFPVAPDGFAERMRVLLGIGSTPSHPAELRDAARPLVTGTLDLMRAHIDVYRDVLADDLLTLLAEGTWHALITQWHAADSSHQQPHAR